MTKKHPQMEQKNVKNVERIIIRKVVELRMRRTNIFAKLRGESAIKYGSEQGGVLNAGLARYRPL